MAGFGARHFKRGAKDDAAAAGAAAAGAGAVPEDAVDDSDFDIDSVLDEFDGSHFAAGGSAAGQAAGGPPSETMQFVMAARQGGAKARPASAEQQNEAFQAQPVATAPVSPEPVKLGAHAKHAGTRFKQQTDAAPSAAARPAGSRFKAGADAGAGASEGAGAPAPASPGETSQFMAAAARQQERQGAPAAGGFAAAAGHASASGSAATSGNATPVQATSPAPPAARRAPEPVPEPESEPRRSRARDVISTVLIVIGIALLLVAAVILGRALYGYWQASASYDELEQYATIDDESGDDFPSVDFDALSAINSDIVGWIYIPGTEINYPVVQTDDNTTYLTKLFDGTGNGSGAIFMDMDDTAPGMVDQQTTLYGHHMNDGSMFNIIDKSLDQDVFDTFEVVYYITADAVYVLKPLLTAEVDETYLEARQTDFGSTYLLQAYLEDMLDQAGAVADDAEERIGETTQVLTLVTCAGEVLPRVTRAAMVCTIEEVISVE